MVEAESYYSPAPSELQSFGIIPLRSSEPMRRYRAEAEATKRGQEQWTAARKAEERRDVREARVELTDEWIDGIGAALAEVRAELRKEFAERLAQVRAEFSTMKAHDDGQVVDMPSPLLRKRRDAA